jgi:hypothetical protein
MEYGEIQSVPPAKSLCGACDSMVSWSSSMIVAISQYLCQNLADHLRATPNDGFAGLFVRRERFRVATIQEQDAPQGDCTKVGEMG